LSLARASILPAPSLTICAIPVFTVIRVFIRGQSYHLGGHLM